MVLVPEEVMRESERYRKRVREPQRALRQVYAPVYRQLAHIVPRAFELEGETRVFVASGDPASLEDRLREHLLHTLDSALELTGYRRWAADTDIWAYCQDWSWVARLAPPRSSAPSVRIHANLSARPVEEQKTRAGFRVVAHQRLLEDLLGRYGQRYDLFARLLAAP